MKKKLKKERKQGNIIVPRKAMLGIAPAVAIIAILVSRHEPGPLLLFIVGIAAGILIAKGFFEK